MHPALSRHGRTAMPKTLNMPNTANLRAPQPGHRHHGLAMQLAGLLCAWTLTALPGQAATAAPAPAKPKPANAAPAKPAATKPPGTAGATPAAAPATPATPAGAPAPTSQPAATAPAAAASAPVEPAFVPFTRIQGGPTGPVGPVAFSPDGRMLAMATANMIRLWDVQRGLDLGYMGMHDELVHSLAFGADGLRLVSGGADMQIRVWEVSSGNEIGKAESSVGWPLSVAYSPDGKRLAVGGFKQVVVYDTASGEPRHTLAVVDSGTIGGLQFSPDSQRLATRSVQGLRLWAMEDGRALASVDPAPGQTVHAVSPDLKQFVRSERGHLSLVALDGLQVLASVPAAGVTSATFSANGRHVAWAQADGRAFTWLLQGGTVQALAGDKPIAATDQPPIHSLAFSPDGQWVASGNADETARIWTLQGQLHATVAGRGQKIVGAVYSKDGTTLAVARADGSGALVDTATGRAWPLRDKPVRAPAGAAAPAPATAASAPTAEGRSIWTPGRLIDMAPDGRTVAAISGGLLRLYGRTTGYELATLGPAQAKDLRFTPDGHWLLVLEDKQIQVWDTLTRQRAQLVPLAAHNESTLAMMFDAKGSTLWLWADAESPRSFALEARSIGANGLEAPRLQPLPGVPAKLGKDDALAATLSPDGQVLALSDGEQTRLWSLPGGTLLHTLDDLPWYATQAFSPDGKTLLAYGSGMPGHQVLRWDVRSGKPLPPLEGHTATVNTLSVSADGLHIATGANDRNLRIWNAVDGSLAAVLGLYGDQGWVVVSGDGYFDAAPALAEEALLVRLGEDWFDLAPVGPHRLRFHKPDLVRRALQGPPPPPR